MSYSARRWEDGDIPRHHHFHAALSDPTDFTDVSSDRYGPCVWELAVQAYERPARNSKPTC
jgi:hypothetical protein